ncbi:MAG: glycosyltransferase 87 family protein [Bacteroidota bacterium]
MNHAPLPAWLWGAAHLFYLAAAGYVLARGGGARGGIADAWTRPRAARAIAAVLVIGLVPRMLLIPTAPALSDDVYRYLWDGRLVAEGWNPFTRAPSDPALASLHDALYAKLSHTGVPTIYPPVAQWLFAAGWLLGGTPLAWKGVLFALEALLVAGLIALLRRRRLPPERLLLYYWNPLAVVECYGSGHVDLAAAAFLLPALALLESSGEGREATLRRVRGGLALGASALVKLVPAAFIPALLRRRAWVAAAAMILLCVALYLPFRGAGPMLWEGLRIYARNWEFNGPAYALLRPIFRSGDAPRLLLAGAFAIATLAIAWRARTLSGAMLATWTAFLLLSPTVYPWYLVPVVALLPLHPDAGLLLLSGTVALTYLPLPVYRATGAWNVPAWILWTEYGTLTLVWTVTAAARALQARRAPWATERSPT